MPSTRNCRGCSHLDILIVAHQRAGLAQTDERIDQIIKQIQRLQDVLSTLRHLSNRLRSPIYALPVEIMSLIFHNVCNSETGPVIISDWGEAPVNCHAIRLSSVSTHWRQLAFAMPELWERIGFRFDEKTVKASVALLQHYASHTNHLDISIHSLCDHSSVVRLLAKALFSPSIARKVNALSLRSPPPEWLQMLSSFPLLHTLAISGDGYLCGIDLQSLPLSRLYIEGYNLESTISLPPSLQFLHMEKVPAAVSMTLFRQCPNLVECVDRSSIVRGTTSASFNTPVIHTHLKKLIWSIDLGLTEAWSAQNLKVPAIESLELFAKSGHTSGTITFCHNVSATLTSLTLTNFAGHWGLDDNLSKLFNFPIPNLQMLNLQRWTFPTLLAAVHALTPSEGEYINRKIKCLPRLRTLILTEHGGDASDGIYCHYLFPQLILDLLETRRAGEAFRFHLDFRVGSASKEDRIWTPELREELRDIVNNRQVDVKRGSKIIEWL